MKCRPAVGAATEPDAGEDGLVTFAIVGRIRPLDVGRQRHVADLVEVAMVALVVEAQRALAICAARHDLGFESAAKRTRSPMGILRPGWTSACQSLRIAAYGRSRKTSTGRSGVPAARGSSCRRAARARRRDVRTAARENLRIVQHQAVAGPQESGNSRNCGPPSAVAAVQHQHAGGGAVFQRPLRDRFLGQVIIEVGETAFAKPSQDIIAHSRHRELVRRDGGGGGGRRDGILSSVVASQLETHGKYGGVVPELASREHLRAIVPVVRAGAGGRRDRSRRPRGGGGDRGAWPGGLAAGGHHLCEGALLCARVAADRGEPHRRSHSRRGLAGRGRRTGGVSGAGAGGERRPHALVRGAKGLRYRLLGKTRDDAAGEAFDKVAKLLGFGYPGGPVIDSWRPRQSAGREVHLARMKGNALDFSFSGLKTAVLRWVEQHDMGAEIEARRELLRSHPRPRSRSGWP